MSQCPKCGLQMGLHHSVLPGCMCQYSTQPPVIGKPWVGLTEEEIQSIHDTYHKRMGPQEFARAITTALKEKNTHD